MELLIIVNVFQLVGGLIIGLSYLPQIFQIIKTKSVKDLNLISFITLLLGLGLMEVYAFYLLLVEALPMFLITNSVGLITIVIMIVLILKYKKR